MMQSLHILPCQLWLSASSCTACCLTAVVADCVLFSRTHKATSCGSASTWLKCSKTHKEQTRRTCRQHRGNVRTNMSTHSQALSTMIYYQDLQHHLQRGSYRPWVISLAAVHFKTSKVNLLEISFGYYFGRKCELLCYYKWHKRISCTIYTSVQTMGHWKTGCACARQVFPLFFSFTPHEPGRVTVVFWHFCFLTQG